MLKKFFVLFLIGILAFTATGCSLFGDDDDDVTASTTVVKTVIKKPTAGSGNVLGNLRTGVRAQVTTETVTGAVVTLTLADGSVFTMTDNGNGEYTATVSGLDGAPGFIIEARKGDLLVQNMVTDLANTDLTGAIESNHLTTAFAQVAMSAAKVLSTSTGIQVATLDDLIKNVTSISIDYSELKRQVTDESNVLYESSRNIVTVALAEADETQEGVAAGSSLLEKIISGSFTGVDAGILTELSEATGLVITTDTTTNVWEDKVTTPMTDYIPTEAPEADEAAIKAAATTYMNAFLKMVSGSTLTSEEQTNLSAVLTEDFILNGQTKSVILNSQASEEDDLDRFEGGHSLIKVDDNTYLIHIAGTAYLKTGGSITLDSTVEGFTYTGTNPTEFRCRFLESNISEFPVIIARQSDGSWKVSGNRIKVDEVEIQLNYALDLNRTAPQHTNLWLQLEDTSAFPIESVVVSGGEIGATGVALAKNASIADSNTWHYWHTGSYMDSNQNTVTNTYTSPYPWEGWTYSATQHQAGQEYRFTVKFKDGSTQTFFYRVPEIPAGYAPFSASSVSVTVADNKVKITWPKNTNPSLFDGYYISVWDNSDGDSRILESEIDDINITSAEFALNGTSYQLVSGKQYNVNFNSELKTGLSQHFYQSFTVPDQTEVTAVAMSKALDAGLRGVAQSAAAITPPVVGGSLRGAVSVATALGFPANTMFYDNYTSYAPDPNIANVFVLPNNPTAGINLHLLQLLDSLKNEIAYSTTTNNLVAQPTLMNMLVVIQQQTAGVNMELYMEGHPLQTSATQYHLAFGGNGTVTAQLDNGNLEIRITDAMVDVSKDAEGLMVHGLNLEASLYQNGQPLQINEANVSLRNGSFDATGLTDAQVYAGEAQIATLTRDTAGLKLIIAGETGSQEIPIQ